MIKKKLATGVRRAQNRNPNAEDVAVQPAARVPHAARRLISCGPPVLAKIVRIYIMCKK